MKFSLFNLDRRIIYLMVLLSLSVPLLLKFSVKPARMKAAEKFFAMVESVKPQPGKIAFVSLDFGPGMVAENGTQARVVIEHLMRRRIPIVFFSQYVLAEPFLNSYPEEVAKRLMLEMPKERWEYGQDWVNLGYRPGGFLIIQAIPKAEDLTELFKKDARGNDLRELAAWQGVRTLKNIVLLAQFTGLVGVFDNYIQFFQTKDYRPLVGHGCTSITIPEAYIYVDSGQINGLLEGIAGAAWYSVLLNEKFKERIPDDSRVLNTGLGVAHMVIVLLIALGSITGFIFERRRRAGGLA